MEDVAEGILLDGEEALTEEEIDSEGSEPSASSNVDGEEIEEVNSGEDPGEDEVIPEDPEEDQSTPEVSESPE